MFHHLLSAVALGTELISVGYNGAYAGIVSANGSVWNSVTLPGANRAWSDVATRADDPIPKDFVAISNDASSAVGACAWSQDKGLSWTATDAATNEHWSALAYGHAKFVAVSTDGGAMSGGTPAWTTRSCPAHTWRGICYGGSGSGLFVAVGQSAVMTSPDGITWTDRTAGLPANCLRNWQSVVWGSDSSGEVGRYVAVASGASGNAVMVSTDGITWVNVATPAVAATMTGVCYVDRLHLYVAVGTGHVTGANCMTSADALVWVARQLGSDTQGAVKVAYDPNLDILVATLAAGASASRIASAPAALNPTWTFQTTPEANTATGIHRLSPKGWGLAGTGIIISAAGNKSVIGAANWSSVRGWAARNAPAEGADFYYEIPVVGGGSAYMLGLGNSDAGLNTFVGNDANGWGWWGNPSAHQKYHGGSALTYANGFVPGDVAGALYKQNGSIEFFLNSASQGVAYSGVAGSLFPTLGMQSGTTTTGRFTRADMTGIPAGVLAWDGT